MSGIFGFFCTDDKSESKLRKTLEILEYWNSAYGHDGSEVMNFRNGGLGCHIEHFSEMFMAEKSVHCWDDKYAVIDALLYNRKELMDLLNLKDCSVSDERLVLLLIEAKGFESLKEVNGDFAGAIYNQKNQTWMLFRDHMGNRPLFLYQKDNMFAFSTDLRALTMLPDSDVSLNEKQLYLRIMGYNTLSLTETEFSTICCITPASYCEVKASDNKFEFHETQYWKLGQKKIRFKTEKEYQQKMRHLVEDAIKCRLDAIPGVVGGELSGGLDSCVIDILIKRMGREARYFSWSFDTKTHPIQSNDERLIIEEICKKENMVCDYLPEEIQGYKTTIDKPYPPYINTFNISKTSKHLHSLGIRAVFTGHGGDEGVSHRCNQIELWHNREYFHYFKEKWNETQGKRLRLLRTLKHVYYGITKEYVKLKQPWEGVSPSAIILKREFYEKMKKEVRPEPLWFPIDAKAYVEQGGSRNRLDNIALQGAEQGVRYLTPFLDYRVIDFAVSIPRWLYRHGNINRYIFREAFKDIMTDSLYNLNTKETPSMMNYKPKNSENSSFESNKEAIMTKLDRKLWKPYLDFNAIEKCLTVPAHVDERAYYQLAFCLNHLYACVMLQNICECSTEWSDYNE